MNVGTSTSAISIHQKIAASVSVPPASLAPTTDATAGSDAGTASISATAPDPTRLVLKPPGTPSATSTGGSEGSSSKAANQISAILKEIARLQKQLASEQKQLSAAEKSAPKDGGPNVAATAIQSEIQSTIAALLKATAALATYMSASSGVDLHA